MDDFDELITGVVVQKLLVPDPMKALLGELLDRQAARDVKKTEILVRHRETHKEAQARLDRLYEAIQDAVIDRNEPTLKERIKNAVA